MSFATTPAPQSTRPPSVPAGRPSGPAEARFYDAARRVVEFAATVVLFVATLPLVVVAGLAVRAMSAGPAIYTQRRVGRGGREFTIYKLRTMRHECEAASGVRWASRRDPRVTPVGRFLRASHLDELHNCGTCCGGR